MRPTLLISGHGIQMLEVKRIETICDYSCSDCDHHGNGCTGYGETKGILFWTPFAGVDCCLVYGCCINERKLAHCGKCPDQVCEKFTRFKDPDRSEEESKAVLTQMEQELRARK